MDNRGTIIIAEVGVNHNGSLGMAKDLVDVACSAGADFVKFQTFKASEIATIGAKKADYQVNNTVPDESQFDMLKNLELADEDYLEILHYCENKSITCFSTAFDIASVGFLKKNNQKYFKIPSGEITNLPYLEHIGSLGAEVFLSTGMSTLKEISRALKILESSGTDKGNITVLHCTSQYPAAICDVNLNAMLSIKKEFDVKVGYSDHTSGTHIALAAVALGAKVIEKHFTLDRKLKGPDHEASIEPLELEYMISSIRSIEESFGDGKKRVMPGEVENINIVRKSIVAKKDIKEGEIFSEENITSKRPGNGISPMEWHDVIGKRAQSNFKVDELIRL